MRLSIDEILKGIDGLPTRAEKVATLQKYDHEAIREVLRYTFDPYIKWLIPEGRVPYRRNEFLDQQGMLFQEYRRFYMFVEGPCPNLRPNKREMLFVQFLESLDSADAALMEDVKDKKLPYKTITPDLVNEAFPGLVNVVATPSGRKPTAPMKSSVPIVPPRPIVAEPYQPSPFLPPEPFEIAPVIVALVEEPVVKEKKPLSEKRLAGLEKARAARRANLAAKKSAQG